MTIPELIDLYDKQHDRIDALKAELKEAATSSNLAASIEAIEKSKTKKQRSRFIRSPNVPCHAGKPGFISSGFFAIILRLRHLNHSQLHKQLCQQVTGMI